ncbi:hypothetical protein D3C87_1976720 [compost metagenome]
MQPFAPGIVLNANERLHLIVHPWASTEFASARSIATHLLAMNFYRIGMLVSLNIWDRQATQGRLMADHCESISSIDGSTALTRMPVIQHKPVTRDVPAARHRV